MKINCNCGTSFDSNSDDARKHILHDWSYEK